MNEPRVDPASPPADSYAPHIRTALVLTGTGTAGAYHAGVLRALQEAGVKLDVVAGRGIGVVGALFAAVDGGQRLWDEKGFWRARAVRRFYGWRWLVRAVVWALAASLAIVAVPIFAIALGAIVFPIEFVLRMVGAGGAAGLVGAYVRLVQAAFAPEALPTWLPRLVVLVTGAVAIVALGTAWWPPTRRHARGSFWWRIVRAPLSTAGVTDHCWRVLWDLVRGATVLKQPAAGDLARRYVELLTENIGQPGFRELVITAHDLDAHRDLVFALVAESRRRDLIRRSTTEAADRRRAEVVDLSGVGRDLLVDAVAGALSVAVVTESHPVTFEPDSYWRGETHRLCDRPASLSRLLEELESLGVQQIIVASAAPESPGPHSLAAPRLDGRSRIGEYVQSSEAAAVRDALRVRRGSDPRVFLVSPTHNPIGPFDLDGGFDDRSDRRLALDELLSRGYEDAYHQFIEPVVGASGDQVGQPALRPPVAG